MEKLQFLLTKDGFRVDDMLYAEKEVQAYASGFARAPYETLYELAFRELPECFDAAGVFLFQGLRAQILGTILEPKSLVRENPKPLYNYRIMVFR